MPANTTPSRPQVRAAPDQMAVSAADEKEMKAQRIKRRVFEIIQQVRGCVVWQARPGVS